VKSRTKIKLNVATWYGYSGLWTPSHKSLVNTEMENHLDKISTDTIFMGNVRVIQDEQDVATRYGYSNSQTPSCESLIRLEIKIPLDKISTNTQFSRLM
jgi:hypothetical protein